MGERPTRGVGTRRDAGKVKEAINRVRDAGATDFYPAVFPSGVEGEDSERAAYDLMASLGGEV